MTLHAQLYLVPLAIGNPGDISPRALETLAKVDLILAEDTRVLGLQIDRNEISTPVLSYHAHNEQSRNGELVQRMLAGESLALVSDAGMPVISDPGASLVQAAWAAGLTVSALPGPNAALTALVASGLDCSRFAFEGFIGKKDGEQRRRLEALLNEPRTLIFYEAPHRLRRFVANLLATGFGSRQICLARELSKPHEEYLMSEVETILACFEEREPRGEFVVILEGAEAHAERCPREQSPEALDQALHEALATGAPLKDLSRDLASSWDLPSREIYQKLLDIQKSQRED